jgi:hypothetical protein
MLKEESLIGEWRSPPGGHHSEILSLSEDGTGSLRLISQTEDTTDRFQWELSSAQREMRFTPLGSGFLNASLKNEILKCSLQMNCEVSGQLVDVLTLEAWEDASRLEGPEMEITFPAGWVKVEFWRASRR